MWGWGWDQQVTLEKAKVSGKQIKALGISQGELPFVLKLDSRRGDWALGQRQQKERALWDFGPNFGRK